MKDKASERNRGGRQKNHATAVAWPKVDGSPFLLYLCMVSTIIDTLIMKRLPYLLPLVLLTTFSCNHDSQKGGGVRKIDLRAPESRAIAAFASGCFWCTEHIFESVVGVDSAVSGYAGGTVPDPTYERVNTETTGHAETVLVYYDPSIVPFRELTRVFFLSHDPTTPNRQGPDVGSSYRSILFYQTPEERTIAEEAIKEFQPSFSHPIVTEISPLTEFYRAEEYHQDYIEHNPRTPYVVHVSIPRFEKFKKNYHGKLKNESLP